MDKTTHIAIAPSPWLSILVPAFDFSKRLAHLCPDFQVSFFIPILDSPPSALMPRLQTLLPPNLHPILLPPVSTHDKSLMPKQHPFLQMKFTLDKSLPHVYENLNSLITSKTCTLAAVIADEFTLDVLDFAKGHNTSTQSFVFMATCATALSFLYHLPGLDEMITSCDLLSETIRIPGCVRLHGRDLPAPVQDPSSFAYKDFLQMTKRFHCVDGFLVNSFLAMEEGPARSLLRENNHDSLVYLVGPVTQKEIESDSCLVGRSPPVMGHTVLEESVIRPGVTDIMLQDQKDSTKEGLDSECLRWLEKQPPKSVLYISFGDGTKLSQYQTNELALGLELSGKKFLWVLRAPSDATSYADDDDDPNEDPLQFLPEGFLERTKEQGLVVPNNPSWAPQIPILSHNSIGGFLNLCEWNLVMESVQYGVPVIAFPLFAEQRINATLLTNGLKVALRPKVNHENGIVEKEEISKAIKSLMEDEEGKEVYKRMECLRDAAVDAMEDDGSSTKAILEVATKWKNFGGKYEKKCCSF